MLRFGRGPGILPAQPLLDPHLYSESHPHFALEHFQLMRHPLLTKEAGSVFKQPLLLGNLPYIESKKGVRDGWHTP